MTFLLLQFEPFQRNDLKKVRQSEIKCLGLLYLEKMFFIRESEIKRKYIFSTVKAILTIAFLLTLGKLKQ